MRKDVITMLFTGDYCYAHTAEKQDTSTKIAGNDNIRNNENPKGGKHPIKGGQIGAGSQVTMQLSATHTP